MLVFGTSRYCNEHTEGIYKYLGYYTAFGVVIYYVHRKIPTVEGIRSMTHVLNDVYIMLAVMMVTTMMEIIMMIGGFL
jgi:hypothetical protein